MSRVRSILIVTEAPAPLRTHLEALRGSGLELTVLDSKTALRQLEQGAEWDLLLADVEPGDLSVFEPMRAYRRQAGQDAPVLALTAEFRRQHIEGMLENLRVRRLLSHDVRPEELTFWVNHELFPDDRRSRRAPRIPARGVHSSGETVEEWIFNLSEDGLFLETTRAARVGDEIEVEFRLPAEEGKTEQRITARSAVVWVSPGDPGGPRGVGLRFLELGEAERRAIKAYVYSRVLDESI